MLISMVINPLQSWFSTLLLLSRRGVPKYLAVGVMELLRHVVVNAASYLVLREGVPRKVRAVPHSRVPV